MEQKANKMKKKAKPEKPPKLVIIKHGFKCYVWGIRVGYCASSQRRLETVLKPYGVSIKLMKTKAILTKSKRQMTVPGNPDMITEFIYDCIQDRDKRAITKLFKEKANGN